jgi:hypothetical protein
VVWFLVLGPLLGVFGIAAPDALYLLAIALLPTSVGVTILRYRLYDIDYLINRALVYGTLTASLAGVYAASILGSRFVLEGLTGESSDASIVLTTLVLTAAFTPVKRTLESVADRRFGGGGRSQLDDFADRLRSILEVTDPGESCQQLAERSMHVLKASGAAIYLNSLGEEVCAASCGDMSEVATEWIEIEHDGRSLGRMLLGKPLAEPGYAAEDLEAVKETAALVAQALSLAGPRRDGGEKARATSTTRRHP